MNDTTQENARQLCRKVYCFCCRMEPWLAEHGTQTMWTLYFPMLSRLQFLSNGMSLRISPEELWRRYTMLQDCFTVTRIAYIQARTEERDAVGA